MKVHSYCGVKCFTNNPSIMFLFQLDTVLFFIKSTVVTRGGGHRLRHVLYKQTGWHKTHVIQSFCGRFCDNYRVREIKRRVMNYRLLLWLPLLLMVIAVQITDLAPRPSLSRVMYYLPDNSHHLLPYQFQLTVPTPLGLGNTINETCCLSLKIVPPLTSLPHPQYITSRMTNIR